MSRQILNVTTGEVTVDADYIGPDFTAPFSTNPRDHQLSPEQWRQMVRENGNLWDHIDTVKAYLRANDRKGWAVLMRTLESKSFNFDKTLAHIADFAQILVGVALPGEDALTPMWLAAAQI